MGFWPIRYSSTKIPQGHTQRISDVITLAVVRVRPLAATLLSITSEVITLGIVDGFHALLDAAMGLVEQDLRSAHRHLAEVLRETIHTLLPVTVFLGADLVMRASMSFQKKTSQGLRSGE